MSSFGTEESDGQSVNNNLSETKSISCTNLQKSYGSDSKAVEAVRDFSLEIETGEFICIIGPSGCGKSTILNMLAGFELPDKGKIMFEGVEVTSPGPERGMVFQDYGLFPWLTVRKNIEFGLKESGLTRLQARERGQKWIDLIGLTDFADSLPNTLSGGMRQRVGMARALVMEPAVLLLDEPFSALDYLTRLIWQREMETIWLRTKTTVLFVTHSVEEALMLGSRIIVMTSRPTRTKEVIEVNLSRPRDSTSDEFNHLKRKILDSVIVEAEVEMTRSGEKRISSVI